MFSNNIFSKGRAYSEDDLREICASVLRGKTDSTTNNTHIDKDILIIYKQIQRFNFLNGPDIYLKTQVVTGFTKYGTGYRRSY